MSCVCVYLFSVQIDIYFFFFNDTATTEIYTLSLHDALPILDALHAADQLDREAQQPSDYRLVEPGSANSERYQHLTRDRKSTRLNSSHANISYAVFCLKKKNTTQHKTMNLHLQNS